MTKPTDRLSLDELAELAEVLRPPTILTRKHLDGTWCEEGATCGREHVIREEKLHVVIRRVSD
jgi:hypothetical protein